MSEPVQLRCCKFVAMEIAVALTETVSCLSNSGIDVRTSRSLFLFFLLSCARSRRPARRRANSGAFSIFGFSRGPPWAKRGPSGPLSPPDGPCPCPWGFWRARPVEGRPTGRPARRLGFRAHLEHRNVVVLLRRVVALLGLARARGARLRHGEKSNPFKHGHAPRD